MLTTKTIITMEAFGNKYSVDMDDCATWMEALDECLKLLHCVGYSICGEKLEAWAQDTDVVRDCNERL